MQDKYQINLKYKNNEYSCIYEYFQQINKCITYTDFSGSKLPDDKTLSNKTLVLLSSEIFKSNDN